MSDLIDRLKREHHEIDRALKEAKLLGAATKDGHKRLLDARDLIIKHLKEENDALYPSLEASATTDAILSEDLARFQQTLKPVTDQAIAFFERYDEPQEYDEPHEQAALRRELVDIITLIESRIDQEETIFYPHFEAALA